MDKKRIIHNSFFDLLAISISFLLSFFRSLKIFFSFNTKAKNIFFDLLDFIFRKWTRYFWKKPSFYKISSLAGDILNFIFKNK